MKLKDRLALIRGGSTGIGAALAAPFSHDGYAVITFVFVFRRGLLFAPPALAALHSLSGLLPFAFSADDFRRNRVAAIGMTDFATH